MATPRKALSNQKGRKSARQKEAASTAPVPLGPPIKAIPAEVAADKVAAAEWGAIMAAYKQAGYVPTLGDAKAMTRLCWLYSEEAELRAARKAAHGAFDSLWRNGKIATRQKAYKWLSAKMGKPEEKTHIAMFDVAECKKAVELCGEEAENEN